MNKLTDKIAVHTIRLIEFLDIALRNEIEAKRAALCLLSLIVAGSFIKNNTVEKAIKHIIDKQHSDGGWMDVEEATLAVKLISMWGNYDPHILDKGYKWILSQRNNDGGWGKTNRDISRIPVTGLLLHLLPGLSDSKAISWLTDKWRKDLKNDTKLTYKGGFFLLGLSASGVSVNDCPLIEGTYTYLFEEQNEDGGFAPWKDHPIGSDPWSTGIVLLGLLSYPNLLKREGIEKTVDWLAENQLPNGLWAYHYIEEGSAYAYWGLVEALKYLAKESG
ncbi:MAG: terpene cyclase/mutase family protein [Deltaproteobacteria bacterium]|nr:terpene cyclase/mutase family protein [Deltaproteobacteria bacterium]